MFDKVEITVKAGSGGAGIVTFRREKYVPFGGPDGGDGGKGGDVILQADSGISDFRLFRPKGVYSAGNGGHGGSKKKHGKNGADRALLVPLGTVVTVKEADNQVELADLASDGEQVLVARGGKGGFGNAHYTNSTHQAPEIAQLGVVGETANIVLELRLIADVGVIGYPNVGKSSLLATVSSAHPKIANYPFTTKEPVLGVVQVGYDSFVLAEIPGLITGAHLGKGLGHDFLHHAIRTRVFIHLVDGLAASPVEDMIAVNNELTLYDANLGRKPQVVAINKIDLPEVRARQADTRQAFREAGIEVQLISAATRTGVDELMRKAWSLLAASKVAESRPAEPVKIFRPAPKGAAVIVHKEGDVFICDAPGLARMVSGTGEPTAELIYHVRNHLERQGLGRALTRAGAKPGDRVRCGSVEWEWPG